MYKQKQTNISKQIKYKRGQEEDAEQVHHRKPSGTEGLLETPGEGTKKKLLVFKFNVVFFLQKIILNQILFFNLVFVSPSPFVLKDPRDWRKLGCQRFAALSADGPEMMRLRNCVGDTVRGLVGDSQG